MGIFVPNKKTGDAMGDHAWRKYSRKQKQEYAIQKSNEEEKFLSSPEGYYARQRICQKAQAKIKEDRKRLGLD